MIRVTVEVVRFGDEAQASVIETVYIWNDGTGDPENGHYGVSLDDPRSGDYDVQGTFDHPRREGLLACVRRALEAL